MSSKYRVICTTILIEKSPQALPSGAACVASAIKNSPLTQNECSVMLRPFCKEDEDFVKNSSSDDSAAEYICGEILKAAENTSNLIVAFSVYVWNRVILEKAAEILRKKRIWCIAGGPEISAHPEVFTVFDFVICGEGEISVPALIKKIVGGEVEKMDSGCQIIPSVPCDLTKLSSPYLDGTIKLSDYEGALWELARGCPFKCSYCYESKGEKKVRYFPMERIETELKLFAKEKVPQVFVLDPTYNAGKQRAIDLINLIKKYTPDTFYYFEARGEFIDRELAHAFTKITCALQIGLQSADENILKKVNRPFDKKKFVRNIGYLNQEGVTFGLDLIFGLPGESLNSFKNGIDFAISLYPNNLELFCLSVLPGTDLFDRAEELHLTYETEPPYHVIKTDAISRQELIQASDLAAACSFFYNEGRAVPWFNTVCHSLKIKPSFLFKLFSDYMKREKKSYSCSSHKEIENIQLDFLTKLYKEKHQERLLKAALDIVRFNGALSRTLDTGKTEFLQLSYNSEYLASEYAADLNFFVQNVRVSPQKIRTFKTKNGPDWSAVK